ncbi:UDP-glucoronosyl and UDP-glucosyl transferase [Ostertagia ostertagi]
MFADRETEIFRELIDPNFPDLVDVAKTCPLVMVNSNELFELTRPTLAKVVNIGGVGIQIKDAKPLTKEFQQIVDSCEGLVVFSFGSVTPSHRMPLEWKKAFLGAFSRFPKLNFVLRYEGNDLKDQLPPNVYLFKWLPQADLLRHPKTVAFISHGGYNSLQEAVTSGVPMITVALFGDQPRNVKLAERHHFAINIRKGNVTVDAIAEALNRLLSDKSYSQNVKRLSQMVKKQPVSADHLLVAWSEFLSRIQNPGKSCSSRYKTQFLPVSFIRRHRLPVSILAVILFVLWKLLKLILLKIYASLSRVKKTNYSQNVKRLSQMVKKQPVSADHLLVAWSEFLAEFKTLENLVPAGTKLNFFQYHSLDVIAFLLSILAVILFVLWKLLKLILLKIYASLSRVKKTKLS